MKALGSPSDSARSEKAASAESGLKEALLSYISGQEEIIASQKAALATQEEKLTSLKAALEALKA